MAGLKDRPYRDVASLDGRDDTAVAARRLFVSVLGAEAGNLALRMKALGGVYLGGGIELKRALDNEPS